MSKKYSGHSKGSKKRRAEDEYDLQTILDDDASNDGEAVEPKAAARNAETNDESVRFRNVLKQQRINILQIGCRRRIWSKGLSKPTRAEARLLKQTTLRCSQWTYFPRNFLTGLQERTRFSNRNFRASLSTGTHPRVQANSLQSLRSCVCWFTDSRHH